MNERDIEMAREAGFSTAHTLGWPECYARFADLIRADVMETATRAANESWTLLANALVLAEREAIDQLVNDDKDLSDNDAIRISKAIQARGNK